MESKKEKRKKGRKEKKEYGEWGIGEGGGWRTRCTYAFAVVAIEGLLRLLRDGVLVGGRVATGKDGVVQDAAVALQDVGL